MTHDPVPALGTRLTGRLVLPDEVVADGAVVLDGPTIVYAGPCAALPAHLGAVPEPVGWPAGRTLLPGLVDIHCHGGNGGEFGADVGASRVAAAHHHRRGTTTVVASLVSHTRAALVGGVRTGAALVADGTLAGVHLEGPFLSYRYRGAQNPDALREVDYSLLDDLVQAAGDRGDAIAQMTFAPERDVAGTLPRWLADHGITPAVGHTGASVGQVRAALDAAATSLGAAGSPLVTHVFNGMPSLHHREPGPVA
ncbi:MAG TPA: hypothetical protein VHM65_06835, partial [Candidatus Lustribacter sp.]|nr:hypothetical protein [Candidatus Lustribacter sp.]